MAATAMGVFQTAIFKGVDVDDDLLWRPLANNQSLSNWIDSVASKPCAGVSTASAARPNCSGRSIGRISVSRERYPGSGQLVTVDYSFGFGFRH